jgi:spermidine/putrescine transport system permease protein
MASEGGSPPRRRRALSTEAAFTIPSFTWLALLFVVPTLIVFVIALRPADLYGGVGPGWTLATLLSLANPSYLPVLWRTLWLSVATTAICLILALPTGYCIARASARWRRVLLLLVIVPFWTSFLIRIFAWKVVLHPDGLLKRALAAVGLVHADAVLLYNEWAVLLVMVYTCLPFAILPIYAAAEKFDYTLVEAARDLGAAPWEGFVKVFLPGIRRGLAASLLIVLIPALGTYVIPDIVGGPSSEMIGNKIAQRVFVDRNLPLASGLSALLTLAVLLPMAGALLLQRGRGGAASIRKGEG